MFLSIVIPALNEEKTIALVINAANIGLKKSGLRGEVVIANNNSTDKTAAIAKQHGARVHLVKQPGYGNTLREGILAAKGDLIIIGDADCSYDLKNISPFIQKLTSDFDFVIGNRFKGKIENGAMPFLHRFLGTPILTALVNILFRTRIHDVNCGMRGFTKKAFIKINCRSTGMEFASEMIIAAAKHQLNIAEVPCDLHKDRRNRQPHLRTWHDGWLHLRLILTYYFKAHFFMTRSEAP